MSLPSQDYYLSIPKTTLPELPIAHFPGVIHVIDSEEMISKAIDRLEKESIIGFDTETRPTFKKGQSNQMALMQLSTHSDCYLFRLNIIGIPKRLISLLENNNILKVGASIHDDFHGLEKIAQCKPSNFTDIQRYVKNFRIADNSLSRIFAILFNQRISKNQQKTNWEAETLTEGQQKYAALDAFACIKIYEYLASGKFNPADSIYKHFPEETILTPDQQS